MNIENIYICDKCIKNYIPEHLKIRLEEAIIKKEKYYCIHKWIEYKNIK
jgi:hypothetical protein